jgi:hypothetical protein
LRIRMTGYHRIALRNLEVTWIVEMRGPRAVMTAP